MTEHPAFLVRLREQLTVDTEEFLKEPNRANESLLKSSIGRYQTAYWTWIDNERLLVKGQAK